MIEVTRKEETSKRQALVRLHAAAREPEQMGYVKPNELVAIQNELVVRRTGANHHNSLGRRLQCLAPETTRPPFQ